MHKISNMLSSSHRKGLYMLHKGPIIKRFFTAATNHFDYIIIGSGPAGCVLANRLSENPDNRVLLLEAGKRSDNYVWFHIPVGYLFTINNPRSDWCFRTAAEEGLGGRSLLYPRGLGLGGCSLINGMIYMRGQAEDYNSWAESTNDPSWRWENILSLWTRHEDYHGEKSDLHGKGGPWRIEKVRSNWEILRAFKEAAIEYGIPSTSDFNTGECTGVDYFDVNQNSGWRLNTFQAFIQPIRSSRPNLHIISEAVVDELLLSDNGEECYGARVHGPNGSEVQDYRAAKEVILTAGSIGSVQILERSGIGRGDVIEKAGVPMRKEIVGVGENLQDHLQLRLAYEVDNTPTLNKRANNIFGKALIGMEYAFSRTGPLAAAPSQMGAFLKSSEEESRPNLQYHIQPLSLPAFGMDLDDFNGFTASVCDLRPTSRGSVHITSKDVSAHPHIAPNYLSTEKDIDVAVKSIELTREIVGQPALQRFSPRERRPGGNKTSKDDLITAAKSIGTTIFHPAGTCKMGPQSDSGAVVDSSLRVHGIHGLRIADCSIMPNIVSGNTTAPVMMIAEKCADMILSDER